MRARLQREPPDEPSRFVAAAVAAAAAGGGGCGFVTVFSQFVHVRDGGTAEVLALLLTGPLQVEFSETWLEVGQRRRQWGVRGRTKRCPPSWPHWQ